MPASRDRHFRAGDIAERLGNVLLSGVSVIAPVPRTEDVGLDVVCTLLRSEGKRRLIAEESFYVQLKSASDRSVKYRGDAIKWLYNLELPLFIGRVDVVSGTMELFACHRIWVAVADGVQIGDTVEVRMDDKAESVIGKKRIINVGPPIHRWSVADLRSRELMDQAYRIVKKHINFQKQNILTRSAGCVVNLAWTTGEVPIASSISQTAGGLSDERLTDSLRTMRPFFHALFAELAHRKDTDAFDKLAAFCSSMEKYGVPQYGLTANPDLFHYLHSWRWWMMKDVGSPQQVNKMIWEKYRSPPGDDEPQQP